MLEVSLGDHGYSEYTLTARGLGLWPVVRDLVAWGDEHFSTEGPRRVFRHVRDSGAVAPDGTCAACGGVVGPHDLLMLPGPGYTGEQGPDIVSTVLANPHRLLEPIRSPAAASA